MNNKQYPTRMHEVLGVEPFEKFQVVGGYEGRNYSLDKDGWMRWGDSNWESDVEDVYNAINNGIIRLPRLTDEQEEQLRALVTLGYRWLIKDSTDAVFAYAKMPAKQSEWWNCGGANVRIFIDLPPGILTSLVSWSDPAPLDIVQVLRQNGEEVEG
mgnify:CR=1 FL=1